MIKKTVIDSSGYILALNRLCIARYQKMIHGILLCPILIILLFLVLLPIGDISSSIAISTLMLLLPALSLLKVMNDRKKFIFYLQIEDTELVCLNGNRKVLCKIPKKKISGIKICRLEYVAYVGKYGRHMENDDFIVLLFDVKDICRTPFHMIFEEQLTQHYMLIGYQPKTVEILKSAMNVPVTNEIDPE